MVKYGMAIMLGCDLVRELPIQKRLPWEPGPHLDSLPPEVYRMIIGDLQIEEVSKCRITRSFIVDCITIWI